MQSYGFQKYLFESIYFAIFKSLPFFFYWAGCSKPSLWGLFFQEVMIFFCSYGEQFVLLSPLSHCHLYFSLSYLMSLQLFSLCVCRWAGPLFLQQSLLPVLYTLYRFWNLFSFLSRSFVLFIIIILTLFVASFWADYKLNYAFSS